jgi:hypothetical protein
MERSPAESARAWLSRWAGVQAAAIALALMLAWAAVLAPLDSSLERALHHFFLPVAGALVVVLGVARTLAAWIVIRRARVALDELRIPYGWSGWIVGWFFVPIANLFRPYLGVRALLRGIETGGAPGTASTSTPPYTAPTPLVAWWSLSIGTLVATNVVVAFEGVEPERMFGVASVWALGAIELLFSIVLIRLGRALVGPLASLRAGQTASAPLVRGSALDRVLPLVGFVAAIGASVASLPPYVGLRDWIQAGLRGGFGAAYVFALAPAWAVVAAHATARTARASGDSPAAPIGWSFAPLLVASTVSYAGQLGQFLPALLRSGGGSYWGVTEGMLIGPRETGATMTAGLLAGAAIALSIASARADVAHRAAALRATAASAAFAAMGVGLVAIDAHLTSALVDRPGEGGAGAIVLVRLVGTLLVLAAAAILLAVRAIPGAREASERTGARPAIVAALALVVADGLVHALVGFVTVGLDDWRSFIAMLT